MKGNNQLEQVVRAWWNYADGDLRLAKQGLRGAQPPYHTICFLAQSAGEKFLKAYLISKGWELKKTHDLVELLKYCSAYHSAFVKLAADAALLNEYITAGRYPARMLSSITPDEALEAVQAAKKLRKVVKKLLSLPPDSQPELLSPA